MSFLIVGLGIFSVVHLYAMLLPTPRDALKAHMGENAYKPVFDCGSCRVGSHDLGLPATQRRARSWQLYL